jgi:hydroxyacylglutathione hydrolase
MKKESIHPIKIAFDIPIAPGKTIQRFVYSYLLEGDRLCLIDTGVAGSERAISTALKKIGKDMADIEVIILTHSHPDHIGSASVIRSRSGAQVWAHQNEQAWIENTQLQERERPVPGFDKLVSGPVMIDRLLTDGDILDFGNNITLKVLHTPGHSSGSISLLSEKEGIVFCGDVVPRPGDMPIYEDVVALANSLVRLTNIQNLTALYSSWADPLRGRDAIEAIYAGIGYLKEVHDTVMQVCFELGSPDAMELCHQCIAKLNLPPLAANPIVARSLSAHRVDAVQNIFDFIFISSLSEKANA